MRRALSAVAAALLAGAVAGCHAPPPPPPPPAPPPLPLPPAFVPPTAPAAVGTRWSFAITRTTCIAQASNRAVSLELRIVGNDRVELSVAGPAVRSAVAHAGRRARFRFDGAAGWTMPARISSGRAVVAAVPLNEATANQVLVMLSGGRLRTEVGTAHIPLLRLPDSDVAGRDWFDCVRNQLKHPAPGV